MSFLIDREEDSKSYYSIIQDDVLLDDMLQFGARLLYALITSLTKKEGYCKETNKYFATRLETTDKTIKNWINDLEKRNYIFIQNFKDIGKKEVIERRIYVREVVYNKIIKGDKEFIEEFGEKLRSSIIKEAK